MQQDSHGNIFSKAIKQRHLQKGLKGTGDRGREAALGCPGLPGQHRGSYSRWPLFRHLLQMGTEGTSCESLSQAEGAPRGAAPRHHGEVERLGCKERAVEDPEDSAEQEEPDPSVNGSPCLTLLPRRLQQCCCLQGEGLGRGVRDSIRHGHLRGHGREKKSEQQLTPNSPPFISFLSKQTLGPVFPSLKSFFFFS